MLHKFNNTEIRTPTSFSCTIDEIKSGDSCTTLDGVTHVDIIRDNRKLSYTWTDPSEDEASDLLTFASNVFITIYYPDPELGWTTKTFKRTGRSINYHDLRVGERWISSISLSFEERGANL